MDAAHYIKPLSRVTDLELKELCKALWDWKTCNDCAGTLSCLVSSCPAFRAKERLSTFFDFYKHCTSTYVPEFAARGRIALRNHEDVVELIRYVKTHRDETRSELLEQYFARASSPEAVPLKPTKLDQERALNLAIRVFTTVSCAAENQASVVLETGKQPLTWMNSMSLNQFMSKTFPVTDHPSLNDTNQARKSNLIKDCLRARRLSKVARLIIKGTDDLKDHLKLDNDNGCVEIFRNMRILKEYLAASRLSNSKGDTNMSTSHYVIPRQLALEVIDSIQVILFPFESDSESILRSLVAKQGFDPDCLRFDSTAYRLPSEANIQYHYLGSRLMDLFDEVEDPGPRGKFEKWLNRKSGNGRYNIMLAIMGLMFALILGVFGLAVAIFQSWVAYYAWKAPVTSPEG